MAKSSRMSTAGRASSRRRRVQVRSAWPPARSARTRLVLAKRTSAPWRMARWPEGLGDVGLADADRAVEDDRLAGVQPAQRGEVADLGGGQLRGWRRSRTPPGWPAARTGPGAARRVMAMVSRRAISSWQRTCRNSRWPSSPAWAWARRASRVSSIPDSFSVRSASVQGVCRRSTCHAMLSGSLLAGRGGRGGLVEVGWWRRSGRPGRLRAGRGPFGVVSRSGRSASVDRARADAGLVVSALVTGALSGRSGRRSGRGGLGAGAALLAGTGQGAHGDRSRTAAGPVQVRGGAAVAGGRGSRSGLGAGGEDALDGAVGRVADRDRLGAGGLQPGRAVLVGQAEHALGGAQPEQGVDLQQLVDDRGAGGADLGGAVRHQVGVRIWNAIFSGG